MEVPLWLRKPARDESQAPVSPRPSLRMPHERFLDKTLRHTVSFIGDTVFNEYVSAKKGFLQGIDARVKIVTLLLFVIALSFQKSLSGILLFLPVVFLMIALSSIPLLFFLKRLMPTAALTLLITVPVTLNLIVDGEPLFVLLRFHSPLFMGPLAVPAEIAITKQGLASAATLFLRVLMSVSFVLLLPMTTPPGRFIKSLSSLIPGSLRSVVAISYRYTFFLVRKVEQCIMGLKSRQIYRVGPSRERRWAASRIGLLFSLSMEFSNALAMAMKSRGCNEDYTFQTSHFKISKRDIVWLVFSALFGGVMVWKSLL